MGDGVAAGHDALLEAAVAAHRDFEAGVERLRVARQKAFRAATSGTVTGREIAAETGLSESMVSKIRAGQY